MKRDLRSRCVVLIFLMLLTGIVWSQIATPNANLTIIGLIPIPGWSPVTGGSFDLATFNPVNRLIYFADGTNHTVTTVDTVTNTFVSSINPPGCTTPQCPSGIQVAPDLQTLVVTGRQTTDWIYDLKTPGAPPVTVTVPSGTDEHGYCLAGIGSFCGSGPREYVAQCNLCGNNMHWPWRAACVG